MNEIYKILNLIAIIQGIFLGTILFFNKKNRLSNRILALLLFALAISMSRWHFQFINYSTAYYYMAYVNMSLYLIFGPLIYYYTLSITANIKSFSKKEILHFIPFISFTIYIITRYHFFGKAGSVEDMNKIDKTSYIGFYWLIFIFLIIIMLYILFSIRLLRRHNKKIRDLFSDIRNIKLVWLNIFLGMTLVFCLILILTSMIFINKLTDSYLGNIAGFCIYTVFLLSTFVITYFSIKFPEVFAQDQLINKKPYESLNINTEQQEIYKNLILNCMDKDRPYLNDALTLKDFADLLKIPPHMVSMTLNTCLNQNFYNFINLYRIEEVKRMLADPAKDEYTVLRIAFEAGFNSKTVFNTMFKKITGLTPSEFRKKTVRLT